jgi:hypothetical protein
MKVPSLLLSLALLLPAAIATAQVEAIPNNCFPSGQEFAELRITSKIAFKDTDRLLKLNDGRLIEDVGFEKYERRSYSAGKSSSVSIEVVSLRDSSAAYSLLTLLRESPLQNGPPGDAFVITTDGVRFAKNREWVRIQAAGIETDLLRRIAISISNNIEHDRRSVPSLVSNLPKLGYDASTLRYFPGLKSFETYSGKAAKAYQKLDMDMEIAQARYSLESRTGELSLLRFPTSEIAEKCFAELTGSKQAEKSSNSIYAKRVEHLVAFLDGDFDPGAAEKILGSIQYSYSVRWLYDDKPAKNSKPVTKGKPAIVWGIPSAILKTVVYSLLFVILLAAVSLLAGAAFAFVRFRLRKRSSQNILDRQSEITRLRLQ